MSDTAVAELPLEEDSSIAGGDAAPSAEHDGRPRCEKCGTPSDASACPSCGWYPSVGVFVEIDKQYEALQHPELAEQQDDAETPSELQKHLDVWKTLIPAWGWVTIGVCVGVLALCVAARVFFELSGSPWRATCAVTLLLVGIMTAIVMHLTAFILSSADDAELGPKDVLIKPFKAWAKIGAELPERAWLVQIASGALSAIIGATAIIGGIPYERLLDWGFKQPVSQSLAGAIIDQAKQQAAEEKSLEEAVNDFAGQAAGDLTGDEEKPPEKPRTKLDCLVIGYRVNDRGTLDSILLATEVDGRLKYIGDVRPQLEEEPRQEMLEKFEAAGTKRAFVRTNVEALWLKPKFTCKASYTEWPEGKSRPRELRWEEMLDEMTLPW